MAKENKSIGYSNACITFEEGQYIITETKKDDTKVYNLTNKLSEWLDVEGISFKISKDIELPSEE